MPFPPRSVEEMIWFLATFFKIFKNSMGFILPGLPAFVFIIGTISMLSDKKKEFMLLISPIPFTLIASAMHKYPFDGRLLLFFIPIIILIISEGAEKVRIISQQRFPAIGIVLIGLLIVDPIGHAGGRIIKSHGHEEIKTVLNHVRENWKQGDLLYLYYSSKHAFRYYSNDYDFKVEDYIIGVNSRDNWDNYKNDLNKLCGKGRVWVLFSHIYRANGVDEEKFFIYHLNKIANEVRHFKAPGAAVYLYKFKKNVCN